MSTFCVCVCGGGGGGNGACRCIRLHDQDDPCRQESQTEAPPVIFGPNPGGEVERLAEDVTNVLDAGALLSDLPQDAAEEDTQHGTKDEPALHLGCLLNAQWMADLSGWAEVELPRSNWVVSPRAAEDCRLPHTMHVEIAPPPPRKKRCLNFPAASRETVRTSLGKYVAFMLKDQQTEP